MAIVRSYNKHTGVCYAYDVQYVWSDKAQKKVPVRKCIGKFDPLTNEIIPNGKRGPKPIETKDVESSLPKSPVVDNVKSNNDISELVTVVSDGFSQLNNTLNKFMDYLKETHSELVDCSTKQERGKNGS